MISLITISPYSSEAHKKAMTKKQLGGNGANSVKGIQHKKELQQNMQKEHGSNDANSELGIMHKRKLQQNMQKEQGSNNTNSATGFQHKKELHQNLQKEQQKQPVETVHDAKKVDKAAGTDKKWWQIWRD